MPACFRVFATSRRTRSAFSAHTSSSSTLVGAMRKVETPVATPRTIATGSALPAARSRGTRAVPTISRGSRPAAIAASSTWTRARRQCSTSAAMPSSPASSPSWVGDPTGALRLSQDCARRPAIRCPRRRGVTSPRRTGCAGAGPRCAFGTVTCSPWKRRGPAAAVSQSAVTTPSDSAARSSASCDSAPGSLAAVLPGAPSGPCGSSASSSRPPESRSRLAAARESTAGLRVAEVMARKSIGAWGPSTSASSLPTAAAPSSLALSEAPSAEAMNVSVVHASPSSLSRAATRSRPARAAARARSTARAGSPSGSRSPSRNGWPRSRGPLAALSTLSTLWRSALSFAGFTRVPPGLRLPARVRRARPAARGPRGRRRRPSRG